MLKRITNFAIIPILVLQIFVGQVSAGSNAGATVTIDLITDGGNGNWIDDGVHSGVVAGQGTKIAVEVFAKGVTTGLVGAGIDFDFDPAILRVDRVVSVGSMFTVPTATGVRFAGPITLPESGFLARAEFTTVSDVTGQEFSLGIKSVTLDESIDSNDVITTRDVIRFNASQQNTNTFSLSLDANSAAGDQAVTSGNVSANEVVAIQIFGTDIQNANGVSMRFEYDARQVTYDAFDAGNVLPNVTVLPVESGTNPTFVQISLGALGGQATSNTGLVGTIRFRTTAGFSGTSIRLVRGELGQGGQFERVTLNVSVALQSAGPVALTPDFDGDGMVALADFMLFADLFGSSQGDETYQVRYDLDSDGAIGFSDFVIFINGFGRPVSPSSGGSGGGGGGTPPTSTSDPFALDGDNGDPTGITYANNRFYVLDWIDDKVYVYTSDGQRDVASDLSLDGDNGVPTGIMYANNRFYVVDWEDKKVYAYTSFGQRNVASDFALDSDNSILGGITYANNRFYVVDWEDDKVYVYTSFGQRDATSDFALDSENSDPYGITYANNRFYVVDLLDDKVYVYTSGGQRDAALDFNLDSDNGDPRGITYANNRFYVVDLEDKKVYVYTR